MARYVTKNRICDLHNIISKIPLSMCCVLVLPEFGIHWKEVSRAVRNARLPMNPASIAKVISRHAAKTHTNQEIIEIISKLRFKQAITQRRTWHVIKLLEPISDEPINKLVRVLPERVEKALRTAKAGRNMRPEVQSVKMGDLIYMGIQMVSESRNGAALYVAYPPGEPVALVSSLHSGALRTCVLGLGFMKFEDACLNGIDVHSLLRIINSGCNELPDHLVELPEYAPGPRIVRGGIDFTGSAAAEEYVTRALGPDPPHLTKLTMTTHGEFYNPDILNKKMKITMQLKCDDVAQTLRSWAMAGAIQPTSELFRAFHQGKTNKIYVLSKDSDIRDLV